MTFTAVQAGVLSTMAEFDHWWSQRHQTGRFEVTKVPFAALDAWRFDPATGNLGHDSGRFFTIEGLQVEVGGTATRWQPIINQPEIGLLGIVVKEFDGVLHCLMQAKMEPGNVNTLQLSPTVQATRSNYTQVHKGATTRYLDLFIGPGRGEVLVDVLQSEQGAWFWRKRNRNIVVKVTGDVEINDDFRWLPMHLVRELMQIDNLVNMDARTVLSCMPLAQSGADETGTPLHSSSAVLSWFTEAKTMCDWSVRLIALNQVRGWSVTEDEIADHAGRDFQIIGVQVAAGNREVASWTQPLLAPRGQGLAVFLTRPINDVLHVLVRMRPEIGLLDLVEMGPTVQLLPGEDPSAVDDPFVKEVALGGLGQVRYDTVHSEEGGRFHHALTRYRVVEVGEEFPVEVPPNFCWLTVRQLMDLLRHGHYLNIEARSLLACVHSLW
ncbi:oxidase EvaA [Kibdelosporangium banguiense]|uniref:Oxidase EvaA n=1 Tax=Kibdelosporangium banguiense TaxID=1365924 RepID=A0ABS4TZG1_9PSEU|nr:NDP-hexose 2,3-dehydratase family protein [Kibdelosporangium banguiense]MBP2329766.1 oxidase EvaA [Kibdelosporangium banguiense]